MYAYYRQAQRNLGKRDDQYQKLSYNIEPEIEILSASLDFAILISYNSNFTILRDSLGNYKFIFLIVVVPRIRLCLLLWWGFWKTMKLLLSVRGDVSGWWRELRLGLSRIQSANFQWWQFGSPREPTRENTDRLTVGECVNVGRFSLIYNFSDLRRLIHTTRFELGEHRFLEPSI